VNKGNSAPATRCCDSIERSRAVTEKTPEPMPPLRQDNEMPGGRAALPQGSLSKPFFGAQGDEHREPAAKTPSPVTPGPTVDTQLPEPPKE